MAQHDGFYIAGEWVAPAGPGIIEVVSPHTEEVIAKVPEGGAADIDRAVAAARKAFDEGPWPRLSPEERADALARLTGLYEARQEEMAQTITAEMGCAISFSRVMQAAVPLELLRKTVAYAREYPWEEERRGDYGPAIVRREPVGVVAAIVPWNAPQVVTISKVAPALLAGCSVVLKPAPEAPLDAFLLAEMAHEAGIPAGVLNVVPAGREVGEHLVRHPDVDKVAFTGSTAAGRRIASICGEHLKRCTLELGGKSAAIFLDDADLDAAMGWIPPASFMISGQACTLQSRILVSRRRHDEMVDRLVQLARTMKVGDPSDPETWIGPLVSSRQRDRVEGYVRLGVQEGAKIAAGGGRPYDRGWYVEPTVFVNVSNDMRIAREEIFGPVVGVIPFDDEEEAVRIANDSEYGLAGSVWTADVDHGVEVARRIRTGTIGVNYYNSELCAPFGGFKASGIGREFGPEGIHAYVEYKSIARLG
ncbi:aldehyde dehydrogenase [Bailinhaonella thermotolerans]|uniref:Aldehyde dehydrogenase n=1 Tax=Bailinhaonella thermotolerans TaxID=1070861 RepID=A0A3A4AZC8_9ACTN|nr:aldehyde dehydrogenase [Bailinhaonella thermotolerans]RJL34483.1 aldehyde dehydrogenase [Bailinhaonella thermotolerans]